VKQGGEPERDDYGLPPVDIEVPNDASELDADVQAYQREMRALRRQVRSQRWRLTGYGSVLERTGLIMPLIAGCLVLALLSGVVLTMFTAHAYRGGASSHVSGVRVRLASTQIDLAGKVPVLVSSLRVAAVAVIPRNCGCNVVVRTLLRQARSADVAVFLVGSPGSQGEISRLASGSQAGPVYPATDRHEALLSSYPTGLTVLLVDWRGKATAVKLRPGFQLRRQLVGLASRPG
jgi:hypothetical protein